MLEHADTGNLVIHRIALKIAVVPQLDRHPILETGLGDALARQVQLLLTERDPMGINSVVLYRMDDERAPSTTDVKGTVDRLMNVRHRDG